MADRNAARIPLVVILLVAAARPTIAAPPRSGAGAEAGRAAIRRAIADLQAARLRGDPRAPEWADAVDRQVKAAGKDLGEDDLAIVAAGVAREVFQSAWNLESGRAADARGWADHAIQTFA